MPAAGGLVRFPLPSLVRNKILHSFSNISPNLRLNSIVAGVSQSFSFIFTEIRFLVLIVAIAFIRNSFIVILRTFGLLSLLINIR